MRGVPRARGAGRLTAHTPELRGSTTPVRRSAVWLLAACSSGDDGDVADADDAAALASSEAASATPSPTLTPAATATATATATPVPAAWAAAIASPYERYHYLLTFELSVR